jgi:hypothetical protein
MTPRDLPSLSGPPPRSPRPAGRRFAARPLLRTLALLAATAGLASCLLDLEGGPARIQVRSSGSDTLSALSIDAWHHDFSPLLVPGRTSETIELPVSGRLRIGLWARRDGRDSLLSTREVVVGVGEFVRIE